MKYRPKTPGWRPGPYPLVLFPPGGSPTPPPRGRLRTCRALFWRSIPARRPNREPQGFIRSLQPRRTPVIRSRHHCRCLFADLRALIRSLHHCRMPDHEPLAPYSLQPRLPDYQPPGLYSPAPSPPCALDYEPPDSGPLFAHATIPVNCRRSRNCALLRLCGGWHPEDRNPIKGQSCKSAAFPGVK
ncbi:hypothetical protein IJ21_00110 [Paenibacillus sp. 32O-W]|nr:hypothetical protein IJ21_00110 [Paenibacillus sp. 32O-W]